MGDWRIHVLEEVLEIESLHYHSDVTRGHVRHMAEKHPASTSAAISSFLSKISTYANGDWSRMSFKEKVQCTLERYRNNVTSSVKRESKWLEEWRRGIEDHFAKLIFKGVEGK